MADKKLKAGGVGYQNANVKIKDSIQYKNAMGCLPSLREFLKTASTETLSSDAADGALQDAEAEAKFLLQSIGKLREWQNSVHV